MQRFYLRTGNIARASSSVHIYTQLGNAMSQRPEETRAIKQGKSITLKPVFMGKQNRNITAILPILKLLNVKTQPFCVLS